MKKVFSVLCISALLIALAGCSQASPTWSESYSVTGTEHAQMWELKYDEFLTAFNDLVSEDSMKLDYLEELDDASSSCKLTKNGESWKILLKVFSQSEADASWFKQNPDATTWVGNIESLELSLYSEDTAAAEENGQYVRYLISFFTPGAEEQVEESIGLYGEPDPDAVVDVGVNQVSIGNVLYSYTSNNRFIIEPRIEDWPEEDSAPAAIRPD